MKRVYRYAERDSGLSVAAVYKESFVRDVYVWQLGLRHAERGLPPRLAARNLS